MADYDINGNVIQDDLGPSALRGATSIGAIPPTAMNSLGSSLLKGMQIDSTGMQDYVDRGLGLLGIPPMGYPYPIDTDTPISTVIKKDIKRAGLEPKGTAEKIGSAIGVSLPMLALGPEAGAGWLARLGTNAALGAGTGLISGDTPKEAAVSGTVAGALPLGLGALKTVGGAAIKGLGTAGKGIANLTIGALPKDVAFGHDPLTRILDESIGGKTVSDVAKAVSEGMNSSGQEIDNLIAGAPTTWTSKLKDVLTPLDELKQAATNLGRKDIVTAAARMKTALGQYTDATGVSKKRFQGLIPDAAQELKKLVGSGTKWTPTSPSSTDLATNQALQEIYGRLRDGLVTAIPALEKPLSRYGDLAAASSGLERTLATEKVPKLGGGWSGIVPEALRLSVGAGNPAMGLPIAQGLYKGSKLGTQALKATDNVDSDFISRVLAQLAIPQAPIPQDYDINGNPIAQ